MRSLKLKQISILFAIINLFTACSTASLAQIEKTRDDYNQSLANSEDAQFLLNIVRVHYGYSPYFVGVDSVTSQSTLKGGFDNVENRVFQTPNATSGAPFWSLSPGVSYSISPVVTYSPVQGSKFVSALLSPIDIHKLFVLGRSLGISNVLRIAVDQIGFLDNASSIKTINSKKLPDYQEFNTFANMVEDMIENDDINLEMTSYKDKPAILLYMNTPIAAEKMATSLHLKQPYKTVLFTMFVLKHDNEEENVVHIQTRSYFNILQFLSNGVDTSESDNLRYGINNKFISPTGGTANTNDLTTNLLKVQVSDKKPDNALLKINYQNKWYYIPDNDSYSKSTLVMLRLVYSLLVGEYQPNLPILTIPVK